MALAFDLYSSFPDRFLLSYGLSFERLSQMPVQTVNHHPKSNAKLTASKLDSISTPLHLPRVPIIFDGVKEVKTTLLIVGC